MGDRVTNIDIRNKEMFFTIDNKSKYKIPSKLFPIASKSNIAVITNGNTVDFENEEFMAAIDAMDLPIGYCYSNSEKICEAGIHLDLDVKLFSGWIFANAVMPVHHAWVVYRHEMGFSVIDSAKSKLNIELEKRHKIDTNNSNWRAKAVAAEKELVKEMPLNRQQITMGKVLESIFYVGSPDTVDNARRIFQKLIDQFPNHPAYAIEGRNPRGRSKIQEEYLKQGIL